MALASLLPLWSGMNGQTTHTRPVSSDHPHHASAAPPGMDSLRLLSISHRTASLDTLERMALSTPRIAALYGQLDQRHREAVVVSTCNRTELYWSSRGPKADAEIEALFFAACDGQAPPREAFETRSGLAAAEHLFRVAAGLESLVVGEAEILGQIRTAIDLADLHNTSGFFVSGLFRAALRFGGKARQETGIGVGALSVASASIALLTRVDPDLTARTVVVIGAGQTGLKAARHLKAEQVGRLIVLNRTRARADEIAQELGCESGALESLPQWLPLADAVVAAAQVTEPIVTTAMLRETVASHPERKRVLLDLSLPRAIEPACGQLHGVVYHDLSGLEQIVAHNRARREREIPRVETLLQRELKIFETQARESSVRPVLTELWKLAESIRVSEIERARSEGLRDGEMLDQVTKRIVDRLLHGPSMALRRGDLALDGQHAHYLRMMFGLHNGDPHHPHESPPPRWGQNGSS
jgi:glutamyl-tRNA reductase